MIESKGAGVYLVHFHDHGALPVPMILDLLNAAHVMSEQAGRVWRHASHVLTPSQR